MAGIVRPNVQAQWNLFSLSPQRAAEYSYLCGIGPPVNLPESLRGQTGSDKPK